ncbi:hypothetical protein GQ53DRAFT_824234 [Thozetella sp. PMI_491]|nr:hypothetical protein GQ53DRAFT_824234 [Thozetella sp. PMI_491]
MAISLRQYIGLCIVLLVADVYARPSSGHQHQHHHHSHARLLHHGRHGRSAHVHQDLSVVSSLVEGLAADIESSHMEPSASAERSHAHGESLEGSAADVVDLVAGMSEKLASVVRDLKADDFNPGGLVTAVTAAVTSTEHHESGSTERKRTNLRAMKLGELLPRKSKPASGGTLERLMHTRRRNSRREGHGHDL